MNDEIIFTAALEQPTPAGRASYLDRACASDPNLRKRVEALLAAHARADDFLEPPSAGPAGLATGAYGSAPKLPADADVTALLGPSTRPESLGRLRTYEVLEVRGRGGFGTVLKAFDETLHRIVAIKVLAPQLASSGTARQRFLREARAAAAIRHENVVDLHVIDEDPIPFLVMEYIDGGTLQDKLDATGPLPVEEILRIGAQTAAGLGAAHKQGKVHRDVKPGNILLENGIERVKLTDFGLARAVDDASLTQSGVIAGTPLYMSPEQARGEMIDHRSDLFSLGSVLYVMCTGHPPFRAESSAAVLKRVTDDTPRPLREVNSRIPEWLARVVERLHAKNPGERFQSASEVEEVLTKYLSELQLKGGVTPTDGGQGSKFAALRRGRWVVTAILAAIGLAVGVNVLTRPEPINGTANTTDPLSPGPADPAEPPPLPATAQFTPKQARVHQEAWASFAGVPVSFTTRTGIDFRVIPPGEFLMGSTEEEVAPLITALLAKPESRGGKQRLERALRSETPQHRVRITRPFAIGRTEVTVGQFRRFVEARKYKTTVETILGGGFGYRGGVFFGRNRDPEFNWRFVGYAQADLEPVWNVSPEDAVEFCKWLGAEDGKLYRLPTEAEWEYACRAGTTTRTYWEGQMKRDAHDYAWGPVNSGGRPQLVGQKMPNAFGLYDMCGNVWEYCADGYDEQYYRLLRPVEDPMAPEWSPGGKVANHRVVRGGGVEGGGKLYGICSTYRSFADQGLVGFRVLCELPGRATFATPSVPPKEVTPP